MTYANRAQAMTGWYEESPYYKLLIGIWKFYYVDSYKELPADIVDTTATVVGWKRIKVPGNWELQGYGAAIYTNQCYDQVIRSCLNCRKRIRWVFIVRSSLYQPIGKGVMFICILQVPSQDAMCI